MSAPLYMDAVITPNRSLSRRGFIVLIAVMTGINTLTAVLFVVLHAAPALVFLFLDVLAVGVAYQLSNRAARRSERIQVSAAEVSVILQSRTGEQTVWRSPTAFTRVTLTGGDADETDLHLRLSDRAVAVARDLTRAERRDFAAALEAAIRRARADPMLI